MRLRGRLIVVMIGGALMLAFPNSGMAAQVIGQTGNGGPCETDTAYLQGEVATGQSYSPNAYGVITSWSMGGRAGNPPNQTVKLLVLRPDPGTGPNHFIAVQKDAERLIDSSSPLTTFTAGVRFAIEPTDRLGIYLPPTSNASCAFSTPAPGDLLRWNGANAEPAIGTSVDYDEQAPNFLANVSAVVEPDTDRDVFGDETQDKCVGTAGPSNGCPSSVTLGKIRQKGKKVKVTATVPGAGTLSAGSASALAAQAAKGKPPLKTVSRTLTSISTQTVVLTLKLTKSAIGKLDDAGKLKLKVKAVYTPVGGPPGSQTKKKKLRG